MNYLAPLTPAELTRLNEVLSSAGAHNQDECAALAMLSKDTRDRLYGSNVLESQYATHDELFSLQLDIGAAYTDQVPA